MQMLCDALCVPGANMWKMTLVTSMYGPLASLVSSVRSVVERSIALLGPFLLFHLSGCFSS